MVMDNFVLLQYGATLFNDLKPDLELEPEPDLEIGLQHVRMNVTHLHIIHFLYVFIIFMSQRLLK
jgi:hypothetical protein